MVYEFAKPEDTIVAISTPIGTSAIGVVRVSGGKAVEIVSKYFRSRRGKSLDSKKWGMLSGQFVDSDGSVIDEVIVLVMRAPNSYTGEDVVEIHAHGNILILRTIVEKLLVGGARIAEPGEFTRRAFLNGKMDLTQAEAVLDQITAKTRRALALSWSIYEGKLTRKISEYTEKLKTVLAWVEAEIDFVDEEIPADLWERTKENLRLLIEDMKKLLSTADEGKILREGAVVVIAGKPNVGKSSLFNALLRKNRAIVSPYPGTTRDQIEEFVNIEEVPIRLVDTAGLRETFEPVEQEGIKRAWDALNTANVVLFVFDASDIGEADIQMFEKCRSNIEDEYLYKKVIFVINKIDVKPDPILPAYFSEFPCKKVYTSAIKEVGIKDLEKVLLETLLRPESSYNDLVLFHEHQKHSLSKAVECVKRCIEQENLGQELVAFELREALTALGEITGETTSEEILDIIFSSFCIGK